VRLPVVRAQVLAEASTMASGQTAATPGDGVDADADADAVDVREVRRHLPRVNPRAVNDRTIWSIESSRRCRVSTEGI